MSDCKRIRILLALRPEDRSESERRLVNAHLETCANCAELAHTYEEQNLILRRVAQIDSAQPEWESLLRRICLRRRGWTFKARSGAILRSAVAIAAIVALILGLNALFQQISQPRSVQPAASDPVAAPTETPTPVPVSTPIPIPTRTPMPAIPVNEPLPPPLPTAFGYGIQAHASMDLDMVTWAVKDLGFGWLKQQVRWAQIEPARAEYHWEGVDVIIESCNEAGIYVLFSVIEAPAWTRREKTGVGPPDDSQDLANFVGAMAARYRGKVHAYEIWSGQNLKRAWEGTPLSAEGYVRLLRDANEAIKAADPNAIVVSGAPTPTGVNDGEWAIDDLVYLQQMYDAGLKEVCDAVGVHPSGHANPPDVYYKEGDFDPARSFDDHRSFFFRNTMEDTYGIMVENGDDDKPVWATEFGWGTPDGMGIKPSPGYDFTADIDEGQQADYIVGAYAWAKEWGHAGAMFLWNLNFGPVSGAEDAAAKYSIVYEDWTLRPAYTALKEMLK
jgi:hypothetical protein